MIHARCIGTTKRTDHHNAEGRLIAPDGKPAPGCWMCAECANLVISEYKQKLGESWTFSTKEPS